MTLWPEEIQTKMGMVDTAQSECGADEQTTHYIMQACPLFEDARQITLGEDGPIN